MAIQEISRSSVHSLEHSFEALTHWTHAPANRVVEMYQRLPISNNVIFLLLALTSAVIATLYLPTVFLSAAVALLALSIYRREDFARGLLYFAVGAMAAGVLLLIPAFLMAL